jgi:hypothetical protein
MARARRNHQVSTPRLASGREVAAGPITAQLFLGGAIRGKYPGSGSVLCCRMWVVKRFAKKMSLAEATRL